MKGQKGLITCENNVGDEGWKQTGSSIRFLIDSEGLGDTQQAKLHFVCTNALLAKL